MKDGTKIVNYILGSIESVVSNKLASNSGLDFSQVSALLTQSGLFLISSGSTSNLMGLATQFLDEDGDGNIMDDIGKKLGKFFK